MRYVVCECDNKIKKHVVHCSASICLDVNLNAVANVNVASGLLHGPNGVKVAWSDDIKIFQS